MDVFTAFLQTEYRRPHRSQEPFDNWVYYKIPIRQPSVRWGAALVELTSKCAEMAPTVNSGEFA
jgi:hypothetical protein